ncbi:MAG: DNA-binding protein [Okeania sp. SIO3C4]|nr:DNA-binding protein [Okeania sp. SIO3B3]NER04955.1 DNA-binding protein [Okeania sp. SIO3C4]
MTIIGTREAAFLLGICCQRVRVLLSQGRIKGAYKHKGFWQIPLYNRMPVVIPGKRGPQGVWCKGLRQAPTRIHVNQRKIKANIDTPRPKGTGILKQSKAGFLKA